MSDQRADVAKLIGVVEARGIEPVPDSERHGSPIELFYMWFAANMGVLGITLGAGLVVFMSLNVFQSFAVSLIGAGVAFTLCGILSVAGQRGGAPGLTLSRAVFGQRGNWGPTFVSWMSFVGWETIMCTSAAFAMIAILHTTGVEPTKVHIGICVLIAVALAASIGMFGHATIMWVQKWLTWIFGAMTLIVVIFLVVKVDWAAALSAKAGSAGAMLGGIGFIAAGTGLGWLSAGADYARYQPRRVPAKRIVGATVIGATVPLVVLITLGSTMAVTNKELAQANDPVAAIGAALPAWMLIPYLITAIFGLISAADLSMYSSGLNLITGGINISRISAVIVDAILITIGGLYITVIAEDFFGPFMTFLTLLAVPMVSWGGVFLVDMIGRLHYDGDALLARRRGTAYWYTGGFNVSAVASWLFAIVVGLCFTRAAVGETVWFQGPLADSWLGKNSLAWILTGGVAAGSYWLLRKIRNEQTVFEDPSK